MYIEETPVQFDCKGDKLLGMLHTPKNYNSTGLLIIVGGPQYRVGSHRQFLLLSRYLLKKKIASLRFDCRGMGDSEGIFHSFEEIYEDINHAINYMFSSCSKLTSIVIWGLCDAASAACMYGYKDKRVSKLILLNPWVRTDTSLAKTYIKHYYRKRIYSRAFWKKAFLGSLNLKSSINSLIINIKQSLIKNNSLNSLNCNETENYVEKMINGLKNFKKPIMLILSGNDLTAKEFEKLMNDSHELQRIFSDEKSVLKRIEEANHTFSTRKWRDQVADWTHEWIIR